mmetsp:Transcript_59689/g.158721  ORF Transcript_59689/g.158721 Transcript_59689/m.158721 type:complete len:293 (+) Transcript_59689:408-1286(+)
MVCGCGCAGRGGVLLGLLQLVPAQQNSRVGLRSGFRAGGGGGAVGGGLPSSEAGLTPSPARRRAGGRRGLGHLLGAGLANVVLEIEVLGPLEGALRQEGLQLGAVLLDQPASLFLDDGLPHLLLLAHPLLVLRFRTAGGVELGPLQLHDPLGLALVLLDLHALLLLVHLLDAVVLGVLLQELLADLVLLLLLPLQLGLLHIHLLHVSVVHLLPGLGAPELLRLLAAQRSGLQLLHVHVVAELLELLRLLAFGLHHAQHVVEDADLLALGLRLLGLHLLLELALLPRELLDPL